MRGGFFYDHFSVNDQYFQSWVGLDMIWKKFSPSVIDQCYIDIKIHQQGGD